MRTPPARHHPHPDPLPSRGREQFGGRPPVSSSSLAVGQPPASSSHLPGGQPPASPSPLAGEGQGGGNAPPLLEVRRLEKHFPIRKGMLRKVVGQVRAVDDVSFVIAEGETLGLVGESGCGKTTTARCILRAIDPTGGQILFRTKAGDVVDVASLPERAMRPLRREMQMIFQDPYGSLNPRMNLLDIVGEPLLVIERMRDREQRTERVAALLRLVGLRPEYMRRFPHAFSGGQRQRIVIARALALNPRLVVADEAVSALDVSVRAQVLNLMLKLQRELDLTYLFVAHDLGVVRHICDRVVVMYVGKIVEMAPTDRLYRAPKHPYTAALLSAVPVADPRVRSGMTPLQGEVPSPANPPSGCYFHPRCPHALEICARKAPTLEELAPGHFASCHRARELALAGIGRFHGAAPASNDGKNQEDASSDRSGDKRTHSQTQP